LVVDEDVEGAEVAFATREQLRDILRNRQVCLIGCRHAAAHPVLRATALALWLLPCAL